MSHLHERADWFNVNLTPIESIHRLLYPEKYDGGEIYEWDGAELLEAIALIVEESINV